MFLDWRHQNVVCKLHLLSTWWKTDGSSLLLPHPWILKIFIIQYQQKSIMLQPRSHGCVGLAEDIQVLVTLCGSNVSTGWLGAGGGRWLIAVETSIKCDWIINTGLFLHLLWRHWEWRAPWSCWGQRCKLKNTLTTSVKELLHYKLSIYLYILPSKSNTYSLEISVVKEIQQTV